MAVSVGYRHLLCSFFSRASGARSVASPPPTVNEISTLFFSPLLVTISLYFATLEKSSGVNTDNHEAYEKALDFLYSFINFEHKRLDRYKANKLDPSRPARLMAALGNPHQQFTALHIAGTKGKGSVAAMCAAALRAAGLKVGLYTSPHMVDFRERVRVLTPADALGIIPKSDFVHHMDRIQEVASYVEGITWFEILTAIAFLHFAKCQVDVAVVEVGLGGRLDATNVLTPLVSVITSLSLDHTYFLGDTIAEIAFEKGGIIKPGIPVVTAPQPAAALERLREISAERKAPLLTVGEDYAYRTLTHGPHGQTLAITGPNNTGQQWEVSVALAGAHQAENATVALASLQTARDHFPSLTDTALAQGLAEVEWPGRLQLLWEGPTTPTLLLDCAHNEDSAAKLSDALRDDYDFERLLLIYGVSADKNVDGMMHHLFAAADQIIVTQSEHPRATAPHELAQLAAEHQYEVMVAADLATAVTTAWQNATADDLICVTGSIFIVGDLLNQWEGLKSMLL